VIYPFQHSLLYSITAFVTQYSRTCEESNKVEQGICIFFPLQHCRHCIVHSWLLAKVMCMHEVTTNISVLF